MVTATKLGMRVKAIKIYCTVEESSVPKSRKVAKMAFGIGMKMVLLVSHAMLCQLMPGGKFLGRCSSKWTKYSKECFH